jgi:O-antigen/teichoic acid export membrane protein
VNGVALVFLSAFQAHRKMTLVSVANLLNDLLLSIAIILVIQSYPSVVTVLLLSILIACVNLAILFTVYIRSVGMPQFNADVNLWKSLLKESTPIAISSLGISTYTFIGPTILKYTRGDVEVGIYSAGFKLISILTLIPMTFSQVVYPIFSEFYVSAKEKLAKALSDSLRVVVIIIVPIAVGTVVLAPKIFKLLFTEGFNPGVIVLQLTILGNIFGYMDWVLYTFLLAINGQLFGMKMSVSFGLASIVVGLIAVPRLGFISLPFIQIAVELCLFAIQWWYLDKTGYKIFSIKYLLKPAITSGLMGAVLLMLGELNLFLILPIGITVYFVGMYALKGFGEQELELIRGAVLKLSIGR